MSCKLTLDRLIARAQLRNYQGPTSTNVASGENFTFAISDPVPTGKYWVVLYASVFIDGIGSALPNQNACLYMISPAAAAQDAPLPASQGAKYQQYNIFQSHANGAPSPSTICNGLPVDPAVSIRVDETTTLDTPTNGSSTPFEQTLLRSKRPLVVYEGWRLLVTNDFSGVVGGGLGVNMNMKLFVAELPQSESLDI